MTIKPGAIYWVSFPATEGKEQTGHRPAVIVQSEASAQILPTVWVVPITSNLSAASFPGTIRIDPDEHNGLTVSSILLVFQLRAIDKRRLSKVAGNISSSQLERVLRMIDSLLGKET